MPELKKERQMGRIVKLPVYTRFATFAGLPPMACKVDIRVVDGVGIYVYYRDKLPSDDEVRRSLIGGEEQWVEVEAESIQEALLKFPDKFPGAITGTKAVALELKPSARRPIQIFPKCERMHMTIKGYRVCGKPLLDQLNGEYGGCILDGFEPPSNCPIEQFIDGQ